MLATIRHAAAIIRIYLRCHPTPAPALRSISRHRWEVSSHSTKYPFQIHWSMEATTFILVRRLAMSRFPDFRTAVAHYPAPDNGHRASHQGVCFKLVFTLLTHRNPATLPPSSAVPPAVQPSQIIPRSQQTPLHSMLPSQT